MIRILTAFSSYLQN